MHSYVQENQRNFGPSTLMPICPLGVVNILITDIVGPLLTMYFFLIRDGCVVADTGANLKTKER